VKVSTKLKKMAVQTVSQSEEDRLQPWSLAESTTAVDKPIRARETISDFLQSKRELFLLQLSINTIIDEMKKIEQIAAEKETFLVHGEQLQEEKRKQILESLKESERQTQSAIEEADEEARRRIEKLKEVKSLNQRVLEVQGEINKHKSVLKDCLKYSEFLDSLTSSDWVREQRRDKKDRQEKRRRGRISKRQEEWSVEDLKLICAFQAKEEEKRLTSSKVRRSRGQQQKEKQDYLMELDRMTKMQPPGYDDEPLTSSDDEMPMFFTEPRQLMESFAALEKENLFLIQNMQETEQAAEELQAAHEKNGDIMGKKVQVLKANIQVLKENIAKMDAKINCEHRLPLLRGDDSEANAQHVLQNLKQNVKKVYDLCGFHEDGPMPTILLMLSSIESRMDEVLVKLATLPDEYVKKSEKEQERKRREWKRIQNQERQRQAQEERNKKAIERSLQPPKKRSGRPIMYRSMLPEPQITKKTRDQKEVDLDELNEERHLT